MNHNEFKKYVKKILDSNKIPYSEVNRAKKEPELPNYMFLKIDRKDKKHKPDLLIYDLPCELKSPSELEFYHFSRAHVYSFLGQTIAGQLSSYADLYRIGDRSGNYEAFLITPLIVGQGINSIEEYMELIITTKLTEFCFVMKMLQIEFIPNGFNKAETPYIIFNGNPGVIMTKIKYKGPTKADGAITPSLRYGASHRSKRRDAAHPPRRYVKKYEDF